MLAPALLAAALCPAAGGPASHLAVIRRAPDFTLTTHDDKTLRLRDLRGKVLLVSFVFTTCTGSCPATTMRMGQAERALQKAGLVKGGRLRLLSITLDPRRDTPPVLRRYMRTYDVDARHWTFLTGLPAEVGKVISAWGMWVRALPGGQLDHPSRIFLVDPHGRVREVYNLDFLRPAWVVEDVRALLDENEEPRGEEGS
jgi:protein SCO1/2